MALLACLALAACGESPTANQPGAVTADEARAIGEAAEMLEERRLSPEQLRDVPAVDTAPGQSVEQEGVRGNAGR